MRSISKVRSVAAGALLALGLMPVLSVAGAEAAVPGTTCVDWDSYATSSAPSGSDDLGEVGSVEPIADGEQRTLADIGGLGVDMRITWSNDHTGQVLDAQATPDFTGLNDYIGQLGDGSSSGVMRYWPASDQIGDVTFEFFESGTTDRVELDITQLLIGGHRDWATRPMGVSEVSVLIGGPSGTRQAPPHADPNSSTTDTDPADGVSGLGSTPIIELDHPAYGSANSTVFNSVRTSYVSTGAWEDRDWTIIDWGGTAADTIFWQLYGSSSVDPNLVDPAVTELHDGLSAYIGGLCFETPPPVPHSIGNRVWLDANDNGLHDADEAAIADVSLELWASGSVVATTITDSEGLYLFDGLAAGDYTVCVVAQEWDSGGELVGLVSSTPNSNDVSGPEDDDDGSDDGLEQGSGDVCSKVSTISTGGEPTGEDPDNDSTTPDTNENLTVDFGFFEPVFDLALRKQLVNGSNEAVVSVGDPVTFVLTVFNQGNVAATDIELVDYVPAGLTLADPSWTAQPDGSATGALSGVTLDPGGSASTTITFTVNSDLTGTVDNLAEIAAANPVGKTGHLLSAHGGAAIVDIDSVPDRINSEDEVDDAIANEGGDEDDHDVARVTLAADGPGSGTTLPATGSEGEGMAVWAVLALFVGGLLVALEQIRSRSVAH